MASTEYQGPKLGKGVAYLQKHLDEMKDNYTIALTANALATVDPEDKTTLEVLDTLFEKRVEKDDICYWPAQSETPTHGSGASADDWQPRGFAEEKKCETPRGRARANRMSAEEAYAVLGVEKTASEEEIKQAHRRLMMKLHPDQGGSTYLAARINEAKEVLLGQR